MLKDILKSNLPNNLRGRSIHYKVIPSVCNLRNMLEKLVELCGDDSKLKQWEKRSYKAYGIEDIKQVILQTPKENWRGIIRDRILKLRPAEIGASCIDIYLVAFACENYGPGRNVFYEYVKKIGISDKQNTAQAIWQVGKGDGVYLGILNKDGTIRDWDFINKWLSGTA